MSARRFLAAATVVIVAVLCVPSALLVGINSADLIVILAPVVLVAIVARPRRHKTPAGGAASPNADAPHVEPPPAGPRF